MEITYYGEIPTYVGRLKGLLASEDMRTKGKAKISLENQNGFHYAKTLTSKINKIGELGLKLEMLREEGLEGLTIPFEGFSSERKFALGEYASEEEIRNACRVLETYNALQSIQKMEDTDKRGLLETILREAE